MGTGQNSRSLAILAVGAGLVMLFFAAALIGAFGHGVPQQLWASAGALSGALVGVLVPAPTTPPTPSGAAAAAYVNSAAVHAATTTGQALASNGGGPPVDTDAVNAAVASVKKRSFQPASGTAVAAAQGAVAQHQTAAIPRDAGAAQVVQAAADAASEALPSALNQTVPFGKAVPGWATWLVSALWQVLKPAALAAIAYFALRTGIGISDGSINHYDNCPVTTTIPAKQTVAPCAPALFQGATALITLGASAGGALVGLFAPGSSTAK